MSMPETETADAIAEAEIRDSELHVDSRLRYIQRQMQEKEGLRLSIDSISYVLRFNADFDADHGFA
jgi:hypothetical protein